MVQAGPGSGTSLARLRLYLAGWWLLPVVVVGVAAWLADRRLDVLDAQSDTQIWSEPPRLVATVLTAGVVSAMVVQFATRLTGLRAASQRVAVHRWFGPEWTARQGAPWDRKGPLRQQKEADSLVLALEDELRLMRTTVVEKVSDLPSRWINQVERELAEARAASEQIGSDPVDSMRALRFGGPLDVLTSQIAGGMRGLADRRHTLDGEPRAAAVYQLIGFGAEAGKAQAAEGDQHRTEADRLLEQRLDSFIIDTAQRWATIVRWLAGTIAGLLAAMALPGTVGQHPQATAGLALLGLVVGGPIAWVLGDLMGRIEQRRP